MIPLLFLAILSLHGVVIGSTQRLESEVEKIRARYLNRDGTISRPIASLMHQTGYNTIEAISLDTAVKWTQKAWRDQWYKPKSEQRVVAEELEQAFDRCFRELKLVGANTSIPENGISESFTAVLFHSDIYPLAAEKLVALRALTNKATIPHLIFATDNSQQHLDIVKRAPNALYQALLTHFNSEVNLDDFVKPTTKDEVFDLVWKKLEFEKAFPSTIVLQAEGNKLSEFLQQNPTLSKKLLLVSSGYFYAGDALALHKRIDMTDFRLAGGAWANASPEAFAIFKKHAEREITGQDQRRFELNTLARTLWWLKQTQDT